MPRTIECCNCNWSGDEDDVDYRCQVRDGSSDEPCADCEEVCPWCGSEYLAITTRKVTVNE